MSTSLATLVTQTRRFLRDYPAPVDTLSASITSSATTLTISDTTQLVANTTVEIDYETILVRSISNATTATVMRGWAGSTSASHATSSTVLIRAGYLSAEIIDAINSAKDECWPYIYLPVLDTSLTGAANTYEFTVPNMPSTTTPIPAISKIEWKESGDYAYRAVADWTIRRDATPKIQFRRPPTPGAVIRVHGFGMFPDLSASADTLSALFPPNAVQPLVLCAASRLLASAEAGRSRQDVGARDDREAANRAGSAISLANQLERRFEKDLARVGLPPMPKHIVTVL